MSYIEIFGTLFDAEFDGIDLSDKLFYCYDIKKPLSPKQSQTLIDIPKRPGLIQASKKFTTNTLILYGFMECTDYDDLTSKVEELAAFLYSDTDKELITSKQLNRYWNVQYLDSPIIEQRDNYALVNLEFNCNDPFAYAITPDSEPDGSPPVNPIIVKDTTFIIANSGHYYARPVITITFNQAQTHIYVQNNTIVGNRFDIAKAFGIGSILEIDSKNETIKLNGALNPIGLGDGGQGKAEFIVLAKDNNEIQVGTDDEDIDIDININFRKVYFY